MLGQNLTKFLIYFITITLISSCADSEEEIVTKQTLNGSNANSQDTTETKATDDFNKSNNDDSFTKSSSLTDTITDTEKNTLNNDNIEYDRENDDEIHYDEPQHLSGGRSEKPQVSQVTLDPNSTEQIMFASDLEIDNQNCWNYRPNSGGWNFNGCGGFINIGSGGSIALSENEISHTGNKSLKITFSANEDYGGAEVRIPETDHVFTRYYEYYSSSFDFAYGMKTHRIRSFDFVREVNNFDTVTLAWGRSLNSNDQDMSGTNGMRLISINANGGPTDWGADFRDFEFLRNRWYCVETEIKLNSANSYDGAARIWVDGTLRAEKTGINITGNRDYKLNLVLFGGWYSNSAGGNNPQPNPVSSSIRYIDDIAISSNRIGCDTF